MIPVFMACDEEYAKYAAVTAASSAAGASDALCFYILDGGIEDETRRKLQQIVKGSRHSMEFIKAEVSLFRDLPDMAHFSLNAYSRFLIPELKPEINKALYIDTDMIVCGDIAEIYRTDLKGKALAAVPYPEENINPHFWEKYKKRLGLPQNHKYFNSGLLLLDCDYMRKNLPPSALIKKTAEIKNKLQMPDQDVLNLEFAENYKELPQQYNLVADVMNRYCDFGKYLRDIHGCFVLHYTGGNGIRPWMRKTVPGAGLFWKHARKTPFYDELITDLCLNQTEKLLELAAKDENSVRTVKLFDFLTLVKTKVKKGRKKVYLFGFIPLYTVERKTND